MTIVTIDKMTMFFVRSNVERVMWKDGEEKKFKKVGRKFENRKGNVVSLHRNSGMGSDETITNE